VNTGEMVVGNIGSETMKMDYTVIGDAVNLGARVEALTRNYETDIIITEFTYHEIKDLSSKAEKNDIFNGLQVVRLDEVKVKGKDNAVVIYSLSEG